MKLLKTLKQSKLRKVKGGVMDIQKELESFKTVAIAKGWSIDGETTQTNYRFYSLQTNSGWEMWQAKAQAVPEWISTSDRMPKEGEEVLVHSLGQVRQVTRDSKWAGGFKERNCYGWQAAYGQSHWMPKSIGLPEEYHFYYKNDAKQKAIIEAQE